MSSYRFKQLARQKSCGCAALGVRKQSIDTVEKVDERTLRFTISSGAVDRDLDMINPAGWQLANYQKNPVVLWAHQPTILPIGKAIEVSQKNDRLTSVVSFLPEKDYGAAGEFADQVYRLARDGYLAATSVGFRPIRWDFSQDKDRGAEDWFFGGIDYHEQELVELSLCTVPSNPEALIEPGTLVETIEPPPEITAALAAGRAKRRRALALAEALAR
ncbi:MAG TPA: hypothetical protein VLN57_11795 [Xanthobacteraceae bacterium]|nr:hypothetical protein [Xanthobacteraceae bacterium]